MSGQYVVVVAAAVGELPRQMLVSGRAGVDADADGYAALMIGGWQMRRISSRLVVLFVCGSDGAGCRGDCWHRCWLSGSMRRMMRRWTARALWRTRMSQTPV